MILTEVSQVPQAALPVALLRDHLRMGSGFSDDAVQDALLEGYLRAALAAVEAATGKAVLARTFRLTLTEWRERDRIALPVAPVTAVASVTVRDRDGVANILPGAAWRLMPDAQEPWLSATLPAIPQDGMAEVEFTAGFSAAWAGVPPDLAQAVLLLAAHYHEERFAAGAGALGIPYGISALIGRWRAVRISGGLR
jgi:uncharacterized phiE125 gp8 family phage protein